MTANFAYTPQGDLNGDYELNADDAVYLLYHTLYGSEEYPLYEECDFDGDGNVTENDAVYLLYHVVFGELYPLK